MLESPALLPAVRQRPVLIGASVALLLSLGAVLLLRPDRRSAWDQASLSRDLPKENIPGQSGLWAEQLRPLLREADALGTEPSGPAERLACGRPSARSTGGYRSCSGSLGGRWKRQNKWAGPPPASSWRGSSKGRAWNRPSGLSAGLGMGRST